MQSNVLEYLEATASRLPDKLAFVGENDSLTFKQFYEGAKSIGTALAKNGVYKKPVLVYMEKSAAALQSFFGVMYAGCMYVPIDDEMPARRIDLIIESTEAEYMICDEDTYEKVPKLKYDGNVLAYKDIVNTEADEAVLQDIRDKSVDTDPIYIMYTSGSTGVPKGVVAHHRGLIDYTDQLSKVLNVDEDAIFGNQVPLYFDASMKDIYPTVKCGATTYLIPKSLFMFPMKLVDYLNEKKINSIAWVVSALTMISAFGTFNDKKIEYLKRVAFCGEVFPIKQFNIWKENVPDAQFTNLYGPTECTGVCCYYHADRTYEEGEVIPIGHAFKNTKILLLKPDGTEAKVGEEGEICILGSGVTHGYYNNPEKTKDAFVINPLNTAYPERMYKSGDMAKMREDGLLVFASRKDYQIKHMGHRIELGEIDANVSMVDEIKNCCSIYSKEDGKIVLFYVGDIAKGDLTKQLKEKLPRYMLPNVMIQLDVLPLTPNGKLNRIEMGNMYKEQKANRRKK